MKVKQALKALAGSDRRLIAFCYAMFFLISVVWSVALWGQEQALRMMGLLREQTLSASDFELFDLEEESGALVSQSLDPRMVMKEPPEYVYQVTVYGSFVGQDPGEFCVFYKTASNQEEFDANYRVWAKDNSDGTFTFEIPHTKIYGLRMDPGIYTGVRLEIERIIINAPRSLGGYLTPSLTWILAQACVPLMAAALFKILMQAVPVVRDVWHRLRRS